MKKLFSMAMLLAAMLTFTACNDDDDDPVVNNGNNTQREQSAVADYTVIFWGMSGGNEVDTFQDLLEMLKMREDGRIGTNVNLYGMLKTSNMRHAQDSLFNYGYDGTILFDLGKKTGHTMPDSIKYDEKHYITSYTECNTVLKELSAKRAGTVNYPLDNTDSLANFIKRAAAKYPAKKYILLLYGHGGGFLPSDDLPNTSAYKVATRACIYDDMRSDACISADNLVAAINNSGVKIPLVFFQCCLLATLENITAYQHCTQYIVASDEETGGGYMQNFVNYLSQEGSSDEGLVKAAKEVVDYYAATKYKNESFYTSHGLYDLSKTNSLINTVKEISAWYSDAYDKDSTFINNVVGHSTLCCDLVSMTNLSYAMMKEQVYSVLAKREQQQEVSHDDLLSFVSNVKNIIQVPAPYGIVFSAMVKLTLDAKTAATGSEDFSKLQTLYNQYMTQLKSMAYIRANHEDSSVSDYSYLLASPTVNVFTMNVENFHTTGAWKYYSGDGGTVSMHMLDARLDQYIDAIESGDQQTEAAIFNELFVGTYLARLASLQVTRTSYTASQFDKLTSWSTFLKKLTVNPNHLTNPGRMDYTNK